MPKTITFLGDTGTFCNNYLRAVGKMLCDATVLLGDNFYPDGINPSHLQNFVNLWKNKHIKKYMILGNHEYSGPPVHLYLGEKHWIMPEYCYMVELSHCDIIMIDTMQLEPNWGAFHEPISKYMNGPGVVTKDIVCRSTGSKRFKDIQKLQYNSIVKCMRKNPTKPKIVCGHYHLESPGYYNTNKVLKDILMPLFKTFNVKAYICGHEHLSEHRIIKDGDYVFDHFIAGGLETRPGIRPCNKTKFCTLESCYLEGIFTKDKILFRYITPDRKELYKFRITI